MEGLSSKHLIFFIAGSIIVSMKTYSSLFMLSGDRDTWILAIFSSLLFLVLISYIINTFVKSKVFDFREIIHGAIGDRYGEVYIWIFTIGLFLVASETAAVEASSIHVNLFIESPVWYIMLFFVVPSIYIASRNLNSILNTILLSTSIVVIAIIMIEILVHRYKHFDYLFPLFKDGFYLNQLACICEFLGGLSCVAIVFPFIKKLQKNSRLTFYFFIGVLFSADIVCFALTGHIASLGYMRAKDILYPAFRQVQRISYGNFIENGEVLVLIMAVLGFVVKYTIAINAIVMLYRHLIKNKTLFVALLSVLLYITALLMGHNAFTLRSILKYDQYIFLFIFLLLPLIFFTIFRLKYFHKTEEK